MIDSLKNQRTFHFLLVSLLLLGLTGCPGSGKSKHSVPPPPALVLPRECMAKATFSKGECELISPTISRCTGVDMDVETACVKVAK